MENSNINTEGGGSSGEISDDHGSDREVDVGQGTAAMYDDDEANVRATNTVSGGGTSDTNGDGGNGGNSPTNSARAPPHVSVCGCSDDGRGLSRGNAGHDAASRLATNHRGSPASPTVPARCIEAGRCNWLLLLLLMLGSAVSVHAPLSLGTTISGLLELQAAEEGDIQDEDGGSDAGDSNGGDTGQHAAELQDAEEGNIQDDNGIGDGGNAGQGMEVLQHGEDPHINGDGIGNDDDARRRRRLRKLLLSLVLEVLRLAALYYVKTVFLEDTLSLFDVLGLCVGIVLAIVSITIECLIVRGVVNDAEADLLFTRSRRVMRFVRYLLILLILLC